MTEERIVDDETGAAKCRKLARYDLIPPKTLKELAEHFGKCGGDGTEGSQKYPDRNWEGGYNWSLSFGALCRHLFDFWNGQDYDPETGSKEMIAVAWHAFVLATFMDRHPDKDDRVKGVDNA